MTTKVIHLFAFSFMLSATSSVFAQESHQEQESMHGEGISYINAEDNGNAQSPINIISTRTTSGSHRVALHYKPSGKRIANLGHTIEAFYENGSTLEFDGLTYELKQMHFHTPSEHLVDGITYPMEMHMVHTLDNNPGKFLVIGVLFREGENNQSLAEILATVPEHEGEINEAPETTINANNILEYSGHYYHYEGSLTTPPYTETVTWLVMKDIHQASPEQIQQLNSLEGNNARHIQDPHARNVDSN